MLGLNGDTYCTRRRRRVYRNAKLRLTPWEAAMSRRVATAPVSAATTSVWRQSGKQVRASRGAHAGRARPWSAGHALATNPTYAFSLKWLLIVRRRRRAC